MKHTALQKKFRWLSVLLACFTVLMLCACASAEEVTIVASGYCGNETVNGIRNGNLSYQLDSNGKLTISGQGPMKEQAGGLWRYIDGTIYSVEIGNGVTNVSDWAFAHCYQIRSITLPETLTEIGYCSFYECDRLKSISIPTGVTKIDANAFEDCDSLTEVRLPDGLTEIADQTFSGCISLTNIVLPENLVRIGYKAFKGCSKLRSIHIPEGVTEIGRSAFEYCSSMTSVSVPKSVKEIGNMAFSGCFSLKHLILPIHFAPAQHIGTQNSTIIYCYQNTEMAYWASDYGHTVVYLDNIDLNQPIEFSLIAQQTALLEGESATIIPVVFPAQANQNIQWSSSAPDVISVENGVVSVLGDGTAVITAACGNMSASVNFWGSVKLSPSQLNTDSTYKSLDSSAFTGTQFKIILLPDSCTEILPGAFSNNPQLEAVYIPPSISVYKINYGAFNGCSKLVIIGEADSGAAAYANNRGIPFYTRLPE